jgi:hypothetical protein
MPKREIPFSIFQENRGQQLVVASMGSKVSIFEMPPSVPNYKKKLGSNKHPYQCLWAKMSFGEAQNGLL